MGYKANRTTYNLVFDDPAMDMGDLFVRVRRGTIAEREEHDKLPSDAAAVEYFSKIIVEWNAEDDEGVVLPITVDGLKALEDTTFMAIQRAWIHAGRVVSPPKELPSSDGVPSLEASIPMEPLSESRAS